MSSQNPFSGAQAGASSMYNNPGALGSGLGSGFNWGAFGDMLGGGLGLFGNSQMQNPGSAAMPYLQGLPSQLQGVFGPYMQAGQGMLNPLQQQIGSLLNNPGQMLNQIGQNFQQSPGYQFQVNQAMKAANQASAAGGMAGTPQEQYQIAGTVNQLANQDYYNYLSNALGLYGEGMQGAMGVAGMGANAANQYGSGLGNVANSMANTAGLQAQYNNQQQGSNLADIGSLIGGIAAFL